MAERIAILADIHGNLPALQAVMVDLARTAPDRIYVAGDLVNRCPWSNQVLDIVRAKGWPVIQGNHDLIVGVLDLDKPAWPFGNRERFPELWWTLKHIKPEDRAYLAALPPELVIADAGGPPIRMVHGVPGDPFVGFEPGATEANLKKAAGVAEPILIAAHTHRPMWEIMDNLQIINPGGVGISHNGDPRAHYMLLHREGGATHSGWRPEFRTLAYSQAAIVAEFHASGFMEFAGPLGELHLRTILTGHAWASDFNYWMRDQPARLHNDITLAVETYLSRFPDEKSWAFPVGVG